jgi:hypothetical protein
LLAEQERAEAAVAIESSERALPANWREASKLCEDVFLKLPRRSKEALKNLGSAERLSVKLASESLESCRRGYKGRSAPRDQCGAQGMQESRQKAADQVVVLARLTEKLATADKGLELKPQARAALASGS